MCYFQEIIQTGFKPTTLFLILFSLDGVSLSTPVNEDMGDFVKASDVANVNGNANANGGKMWSGQDNQNMKPDRVVRVRLALNTTNAIVPFYASPLRPIHYIDN